MSITAGTDAYIDITGADEYFSGRLYSEGWANATEADIEKALKQATKQIDRLPLKGRPVDKDQPLAFPRVYFSANKWWVQEDIPQAVKDACCEEALALLEYGNSERLKLQREGVTSFSIGNLSESYKTNTGASKELISNKVLISSEALQLMKPYIAGSVALV